jgi:ATP-dependent RNA helicase HelY
MPRPRKANRGRRRTGGRDEDRHASNEAARAGEGEPGRPDSRRHESRQHDSRQHDSHQHSDGRPRRGPREGQSAQPRSASAAAADSASRVATRQARTRPLRQLLEGIGTPDAAPFNPDPFQLEALGALEHEDVLVTAPTGSGKTWIAREEIRRLLAEGKRAWYTSPLKALTNSKYHEFSDEFGQDKVGILTGDRKERSDAPLIVGTTEVYRNQLFDALRRGEQLQADLVVLDEAHYLADAERGHVWEEAIILTPPRVRMLLLSATVGRAEEFADWIAEVRGHTCRVVSRPGARPVPLRAAFLFPDGGLTPLYDERGHFNNEIARFMQTAKSERQGQQGRYGRGGQQRRAGMPEMPPSILLAALGSYDLLPAIVFLPTRRRCDEAAAEAAYAPRRGAGPERREARRRLLEELTDAVPGGSQTPTVGHGLARRRRVAPRGTFARVEAGHREADERRSARRHLRDDDRRGRR